MIYGSERRKLFREKGPKSIRSTIIAYDEVYIQHGQSFSLRDNSQIKADWINNNLCYMGRLWTRTLPG